MRDLLLKNLTSLNRGRKVLLTREVFEENGVKTKIHRSFVYLVRNSEQAPNIDNQRKIYVLKYHNSQEQTDKFFCRIKGSIFAVANEKTYVITFLNSFKLEMSMM